MRKYFLFSYQFISQQVISEVEKTIENRSMYIQHADNSSMLLVVEEKIDPVASAKFVQQEIWNRNAGMYCVFTEVQEYEIEDFL